MAEVQINSTPGSSKNGGGTATGVILGVILAIVLLAAVVWFVGFPHGSTSTTAAPVISNPTININNPPSQPAPGTSTSPAKPAP